MDEGATSEKEPQSPEIGLMDLKLEVREKIWSHLLPEPKGQKPHPHHCCGYLPEEETDEELVRPICSCQKGPQELQILGTCHTIFDEAMPILYAPLELRIIMPLFDMPINNIKSHLLPKVPSYARERIKSLVVVGDGEESAMKTVKVPCFMDREAMPLFWPIVWSTFPNTEKLRIHIDRPFALEPKYFSFQGFLAVAQFPKLQEITIELHFEGAVAATDRMKAAYLGCALKAFLVKELELIEKEVKVEVKPIFSTARPMGYGL